jgi:hypothetical protein
VSNHWADPKWVYPLRDNVGCVGMRREHYDALAAELDAVASAIGTSEYLDPPDGGSVTLAEQVARMRAERDALLHLIQTHQPAGSPPPGGPVELARWVLDALRSRLAVRDAEREALLVANDDFVARLAEAEAQRDAYRADVEREVSAHCVTIATLNKRDARLAEAEALLKSARFAIAIAITASVSAQAKGHYRKMLADTDAFLTPADQPRCFRCGHAQHSGDCVNTAPDQPRRQYDDLLDLTPVGPGRTVDDALTDQPTVSACLGGAPHWWDINAVTGLPECRMCHKTPASKSSATGE